MDYKEKYEQALSVAQDTYNTQPMYREWLEKMFPELAESEDERIVKELLTFFRESMHGGHILTNKEYDSWIAWLEKQKEPLDKGEISDGYHTFNELYYYRMLYNAAFFNLLPKEWVHKSKKHHTGEECFGGGWFIVMAELPTGQISNHYEMKDWDLFDIPEKDVADEWDGHTPQEAAERLHNYLLEKQGEQEPILDIEIPFGAKDSELQEATNYIPKGYYVEIGGDKVTIKKGEQKPNPCDGCINRKGCINCENGELRETEQKPIEIKSAAESLGVDSETYNKIVDECIFGEQKSADTVEPKFHEGDWIVENGVNRNPVQITSFEEEKGVGTKVWFNNVALIII